MNIPLTPLRFLRYANQQFPHKIGVVCAFHSLSDGQKKQYYWALADLRALMAEIANQIPQRKIAS